MNERVLCMCCRGGKCERVGVCEGRKKRATLTLAWAWTGDLLNRPLRKFEVNPKSKWDTLLCSLKDAFKTVSISANKLLIKIEDFSSIIVTARKSMTLLNLLQIHSWNTLFKFSLYKALALDVNSNIRNVLIDNDNRMHMVSLWIEFMYLSSKQPFVQFFFIRSSSVLCYSYLSEIQ